VTEVLHRNWPAFTGEIVRRRPDAGSKPLHGFQRHGEDQQLYQLESREPRRWSIARCISLRMRNCGTTRIVQLVPCESSERRVKSPIALLSDEHKVRLRLAGSGSARFHKVCLGVFGNRSNLVRTCRRECTPFHGRFPSFRKPLVKFFSAYSTRFKYSRLDAFRPIADRGCGAFQKIKKKILL